MFDLKNYQPQPNSLDNNIILITGAGDGIGRTLAKTTAAHGATVILLGRTVSKLESVYDEIEQSGHPQPAIFPLDLETAKPENYKALQQSIEENFGQLDGLIHNAALLGDRTSIASYRFDIWQRLIQVNINAPFLLTQALLPTLQKSQSASIIFTGSSVGYKGRAYWGAYAMTKAANENMMQTLADELEDISQIRVNSINPGATRTDMRASAFPAEDPATLKTADKLMPIYLYLLSRDSDSVSGQQFDFQLIK